MRPAYHCKFRHQHAVSKRAVALMTVLLLAAFALPPHQAMAQPTINVWYGSPQKFGQIGTTQRWVNILGDIFSGNGVKSFAYTLNSGTPVPLNFLADSRRIALEGNFNVDILVDSLHSGANSVDIEVTDNGDLVTHSIVEVDWTPGRVWPQAYSVALTSSPALSDSVQVSDGKWTIDANGLRISEPGYDRIILIGDSTWTDYEVTAKIFVTRVDTSDTGYNNVSGNPAVGFMMRWNGYTDDPVFDPPITQPKSGYLPYGSLGWFSYKQHHTNGLTDQWQLLGNNLVTLDSNVTSPLLTGTWFNLKMRVETNAGRGKYSFKAWQDGTTEPASWLMTGEDQPGDPTHGCFMLMAHHVDVTFKDVKASPLGTLAAPVLVSPADNATGVVSGAALKWNRVDNAASYDLQVSTSSSFTGGMLVDQTGLADTSSTLPAIAGTTVYFWHVRADNADGSSAYSTTRQFTVSGNPLRVVAKAFLEGPYSSISGTMNTTLRSSGVLATHMPGALIPAQAVDTVTVEVRDSAAASKATLRSSVRAWILADGTFKLFADTTKAFVQFSGLNAGNYYVVIRHRNHLAVMSSTALSLSGTSSLYDFTTAQAKAYGTNPMKQLTTGVFGMYAGDANGSGIVTASDANAVFGALNGTGYNNDDVNLTGIVTAADANTIFGNLNKSTQVP